MTNADGVIKDEIDEEFELPQDDEVDSNEDSPDQLVHSD